MRSLPKLLRSAIAASVLALAGGLATAADADALKADLGHYLPIRTALAADTTDGVKEHALALAKSADKAVGDLSKALIPVVGAGAK